MALQVILAAVSATLINLLHLPAAIVQEEATTPQAPGFVSPAALQQRIYVAETHVDVRNHSDASVANSLQRLREQITYSLDGLSGVEFDSNYLRLTEDVEALLREVELGNTEDAYLVRKIESLGPHIRNTADGLKRR